MQTFLPYSDFTKSAKVLDRQRLGKQRVEVLQILRALNGESKGWTNHPVTKMWKNYQNWLVVYGITMCNEWISRGYKDTCKQKIFKYLKDKPEVRNFPEWLKDDKLCSSHRSSLLVKNFTWYSQFGWTDKLEINYYWPT